MKLEIFLLIASCVTFCSAVVEENAAEVQMIRDQNQEKIVSETKAVTDSLACEDGMGGGGTGRFNKLTFNDNCQSQDTSNCALHIDTMYEGVLEMTPNKNYDSSLILTISTLPFAKPSPEQNPAVDLKTDEYPLAFELKRNYSLEYSLTFPKDIFLDKHGAYDIQMNLTSTIDTVICRRFKIRLDGSDNGNGASSLIFFSFLIFAQQVFLVLAK